MNNLAQTPLMIASFRNHIPIIEYLLKTGAKLDASDWQGNTALMLAASEGHSEVVQVRLFLDRL